MKKILILLLFLFIVSCSPKTDKKIVVGASATPHALILEQCRGYIESKGYTLEIKVFNDYVLPNLALSNGELDANYFQHTPYLNEFNKEYGTKIYGILKVHFEPMGIYQGTGSDKIIVPSDKSNYDRAIALLDKYSITGEIVMAEAQNIPLLLSDCKYACINGNYALASGVVDKCLMTEDWNDEMANIIAVTAENDKTRILVEALKQDNIKTYIETTFGGSVLCMK